LRRSLPYGELFFERRDYWNTPYKFNAKELDAETGMYYYGARYYTPEVSIWLSVDPLADKYPSMSAFMYCAGNPVRYIDPDGMDWFQNEKTGDVYYNSDMRKGDEGTGAMTGKGWKHMGENTMFTKDDYTPIGSEMSLIAKNGGEIKSNDDGSITGELMLQGDNAKKFMGNQGYTFSETVRYVEEYSDVTMSPDAQTLSDDWEKIVARDKYRYVKKDDSFWVNTGSYKESYFSRLDDKRTRTINYQKYEIKNNKGLNNWHKALLKVGFEVFKTVVGK
jgi:RHS repeat-associated protein